MEAYDQGACKDYKHTDLKQVFVNYCVQQIFQVIFHNRFLRSRVISNYFNKFLPKCKGYLKIGDARATNRVYNRDQMKRYRRRVSL